MIINGLDKFKVLESYFQNQIHACKIMCIFEL